MDRLEATLTALGIVCGMCVLLSPAACTMHTDYRIQQAIKGGADPILASCALSINGSTLICAARASALPAKGNER